MQQGGLEGESTKHNSSLESCSAAKVEELAVAADIVYGVGSLKINGDGTTSSDEGINNSRNGDGGGVQVTCFTQVLNDVTFNFQIIRFHKQIYAWIGCNSAKFGNLYASAPTRSNNAVSVTNILGGDSDNAGSGIARRIVLKTGLNVILACNVPKNSPKLEADAEKMLVQKLINLGYTTPKSNGSFS